MIRRSLVLVLLVATPACKARHEPQPRQPVGSAGSAGSAAPAPAPTTAKGYDRIPRADFNRLAVRKNLPVYWIADTNDNKTIDPDEVSDLLFYPPGGPWVDGGKLTPAFDTAYTQLVDAAKEQLTDPRRQLVAQDLDQGLPSLVLTDATKYTPEEKAFADHMLGVARLIDALYDVQSGAAAQASQVANDPESQSLFRRNRGPKCVAPATENNPSCNAIPGAPKTLVDVYPDEPQKADDFCKQIEGRPDAKKLLGQFTVVRADASGWKAIPYSEAYKDQVQAIAKELLAAADAIKDPSEAPLVGYLRAAAASFQSNDWNPADEAWAKMSVDNSKWYVRVGPDETYWEPCAHKAGFHLTFARINQGSRQWQQKLVPVQQEMEAEIAKRAGAPYTARKVTFHLPDFIDIVLNAGDDRHALGATIGQSLPNWGPVAKQGRGRTVAMVNLYADPDSRAARRGQAESLLDAASMKLYPTTADPGLLTTILHEATHNLGPANEYTVGGKTPEEAFSGPIASMMEELKAQTGGLFLVEFLRSRKLITDELAQQAYTDAVVWAFGHISQGMYTGTHARKAYGNLAAIQIGFLIDKGALTWDANATAGNGKDKGAFTLHIDKMPAVADELMKTVASIKAKGDRAAAEALLKRYADAKDIVPHDVIAERFLRFPKASFMYAIRWQ